MSKIKLILDSSIFNNFTFQNTSKELDWLKFKEIATFYITPMLLEEILVLLLYENKRTELTEYLNFILKISNDKWFENCFEIFRSELRIIIPPRKDYKFCTFNREKNIKENIQNVILGGNLLKKDQKYLIIDKKQVKDKSIGMRRIGNELRLDISKNLKKANKKRNNITEAWTGFMSQNLTKFGEDLIRKNFRRKLLTCFVTNKWHTKKETLPFFMDWVNGILYMQYYAMRYPDEPLDDNAQADIQHLIFLREVDGIVSNDQSFMKKAWEDLYKPLGKLYINPNELHLLRNSNKPL